MSKNLKILTKTQKTRGVVFIKHFNSLIIMIQKIKKIINEKKGQISAEMIILLAAIVAIVLVIITQLQKTTTKANKTVEGTADKIFDKIEDIE